jgi:MFS transporter, AAHS family, 4-hydroxybenzoate transporter
MAKVIDIEALFDDQKIGGFHIKLLLISFLVLITDGFDLGAAPHAGPGSLKEWNMGGRNLGAVFSSSIAAGFLGLPLFGFLLGPCGSVCDGMITARGSSETVRAVT